MKNIKYLSIFGLMVMLIGCDDILHTSIVSQNQTTPKTAQETSFASQSLDYEQLEKIMHDEQYLSCQADTECTKIQTKACQVAYASNVKYKQHTQDYFDMMERAVEYIPPNKTLDDFDVICQEKICTLIDKSENN